MGQKRDVQNRKRGNGHTRGHSTVKRRGETEQLMVRQRHPRGNMVKRNWMELVLPEDCARNKIIVVGKKDVPLTRGDMNANTIMRIKRN